MKMGRNVLEETYNVRLTLEINATLALLQEY